MAPQDEEQRRLEEIRRKAEEEEARRIDEDISKRTEELMRARKRKVQEQAQQEEEALRRAEETARRAEEERKKAQEEAERKRAEEEKRKAEEEAKRRRVEEEKRKKAEEEARRKREEEEKRRKAEEEKQKKAEVEARRKKEEEEAKRRAEEEARRKAEEEARRKEEEKQENIRQALRKAEDHLTRKEHTEALTHIDGIISLDPMNVEALEMRNKIQSLQAADMEAQQAAKAAVTKERAEEVHPKAKTASKGILIGIAGVLAVVVIGFLVSRFVSGILASKPSVAILPLVSQTNSTEEKVLGAALAEDISSRFSHLPDMRVMGSASALNIRTFARDPQQAARDFGFTHYVSGSLALSGTHVAVAIEVIDTAGVKIWSGKLEKSRDQLPTVAPEVVSLVSEALSASVPNEVADLAMSKATDHAEAYITYLRGRELLPRGGAGETRSATDLFMQAVSLDRQFAQAHSAAGLSMFQMYERGWSNDMELLTRAEHHANTALNMQPRLSEPRTVLGGILMLRGGYRRALGELEQAITRMPNNAKAYRLTGLIHCILGSENKALSNLLTAYEIDGASPEVITTLALVHLRFGRPKEAMVYFNQALPFVADSVGFLAEVAGDALIASYEYDRAIEVYRERVRTNPTSYVDHYRLARAYQLAGRQAAVWTKAFEQTIELLQQELRRNPNNALATAYLGLAYSRYGRFADGESAGTKAVQMAPNDPTIRYKIADIYSIQKKKDAAFTALQEAMQKRYTLSEIVDLDLFNISNEPQFAGVITRNLK